MSPSDDKWTFVSYLFYYFIPKFRVDCSYSMLTAYVRCDVMQGLTQFNQISCAPNNYNTMHLLIEIINEILVQPCTISLTLFGVVLSTVNTAFNQFLFVWFSWRKKEEREQLSQNTDRFSKEDVHLPGWYLWTEGYNLYWQKVSEGIIHREMNKKHILYNI